MEKKTKPNTTTNLEALRSFSLLQKVWRALRFSLQSLTLWPWSNHFTAHAPTCRLWGAVLWICLVQLSWSAMVGWNPTIPASRCQWSQRGRIWNICKVLTECFEPSGAVEVPGIFFCKWALHLFEILWEKEKSPQPGTADRLATHFCAKNRCLLQYLW